MAAGGRRSLDPRSRTASALRMSRREMLGERQVAAPLMAQRAAPGALRLAHRRFQPGEGVGTQLAGLRLSGKPQRPSQCQFGHETLVLAFALFAPAGSLPPRPALCRAAAAQAAQNIHVRHWLDGPCPYGSGARNGGYSRGTHRGLRHVGYPVTEQLRSIGGLLRATHTIGVAQVALRRSLRSSHPAELAGRSCPHRWTRSGLLHPGGLRRENRRRCHLIVTSTRTSTRKIVELRGFEPLTFCMPHKSLLFRNVAGCGPTRSFNRCTLPAVA